MTSNILFFEILVNFRIVTDKLRVSLDYVELESD